MSPQREMEIETVATLGKVTLTITDDYGHPHALDMSADAAARMSMQLARAATHAMGLVIDEAGKVAP